MVRKHVLTVLVIFAAATLAQAVTIQVKRGPASTVPVKLKMGELGVTTDTQRAYMGYSTTKKELVFRDSTFSHISSAAMSGGGGGTVTANYVLAAPNGSAGTPVFRALVAADIPTLNQSTTGNAATATALQNARTINGVSFNGTANITVADATKEPVLGNPAANGYVLSSTTGGTRSWVAQSGGVTLTSTYPSTSTTTAATPDFVNKAIFANNTGAFTYSLAGAANKLAKYDGTDALTGTVGLPASACNGTANKITYSGTAFTCESDQTGAGGSGITSLGGLTATTQSFANDTNVTMTSDTSTHTLGWTGYLAKARGGAGADMTNVTFPSSGTLLTTTGNAAGLSAAYIDWAAVSGGASILNKPALPATVSCGAGNHVSSYDPATGAFSCTADATSGGATDTNAVHVNTAGEIAAVTAKATPVSGDYLLIEDSAATNAKKRITVGTLPFQSALVSGTSIKTVGGVSLLGSGDVGVLGAAYGGTGVNNSGKTITLGGNLVTSGAFNLTLAVPATGTWTLPAAGTLIGSADTGTVTNTMLAGSIANAKLASSSVTIGSTSVSLGGTAATVAGLTLTNPTISGAVISQTTSTTMDTSAVSGATISSAGATTLTITNVVSGKYFDFKVSSSGGGTLTIATLTPTWVTGTPASITAGKASWFVCKGTGANTADCAAIKENF